MPLFHMLSKKQQNASWKEIAQVARALEQTVSAELATQDRIPNKWKDLLRRKMLKQVSAAAEKYFRKRLRRQQRLLPETPAILISDESDDVEIVSDELYHPCP